MEFAGEGVRIVEENENIMLETQDDFEAEVRQGWILKPQEARLYTWGLIITTIFAGFAMTHKEKKRSHSCTY